MKLLFPLVFLISFFIAGGLSNDSTSHIARAAITLDPQADVRGPLDLKSATASQNGPKLTMRWNTYTAFRFSSLGNNRILCQRFRWDNKDRRQICLVKNAQGIVIAYASSLDGTKLAKHKIPAKITRATLYDATMQIKGADLRLPVRYMTVKAFSHWSPEGPCPEGVTCRDYYPDANTLPFRWRAWALASCTAKSPYLRYSGPTSPRRVAISFDDGPSNFTGQVMEAIRPYDGKITFFVIGQNVTALPATAAALQQGYVFDVLCR